jgi:hypothetical protein
MLPKNWRQFAKNLDKMFPRCLKILGRLEKFTQVAQQFTQKNEGIWFLWLSTQPNSKLICISYLIIETFVVYFLPMILILFVLFISFTLILCCQFCNFNAHCSIDFLNVISFSALSFYSYVSLNFHYNCILFSSPLCFIPHYIIFLSSLTLNLNKEYKKGITKTQTKKRWS